MKNVHASTEARIEYLAEEMRSFRFRRGETIRRLCKEWDLSIQRMRELSAEAHKRVKGELADPERARMDVNANIEFLTETSLEIVRMSQSQGYSTDGGLPDPTKAMKVLSDVTKIVAMLAGLNAPTKMQVETSEALPQDPKERVAMLEALLEREKAKAGT